MIDGLKEVEEALTYLGFRVGDRRPLEFNPKERVRDVVQELEAEVSDLNRQLKEFSARVLELEDALREK